MSLTINVDSDGVVYDFNSLMTHELNRAGHTNLDQGKWDFGLTRDEFLPVFDKAIRRGVFALGDPIPYAVETIQELQERGHRVRIVTSKMFPDPKLTLMAQSDTLAWYAQQGLTDLEFVFTGNGHKKQGYLADVVIDDKPTLEWTQDDALNILFDQPWNRSTDAWGCYRAFSWPGVLRIVEGLPVVV